MVLQKIRTDFAKNFLTLFTGSALAQGITLALAPVLARIYDPADFGVWSLFTSFVAIVGVAATLRYELAIVLPQKDTDAKSLVLLGLLISGALSVLLFFILLVFKGPLSYFSAFNQIGAYLFLTPIMVFFIGAYQSFNYWSTRKKTFKSNAYSRVGQNSAMSATNLGYGVVQNGAGGLIFGTLIGQIVGTLIIAYKPLRNLRKFFKDVSVESVHQNRKKYINFAKINTPHALLDTFQNFAVVFILEFYFTALILGLYAFAFRILKAPLSLIGSALAQVFFEKATRAIENGQSIRPLFFRLQKNMFLIAIIPFAILFFYAPEIFSFVFSDKYTQAGKISQILVPWIFLNFLISPFSNLPIVLNQQRGAFVITVIDFLLKLASLAIGGYTKSYTNAFILLSLSGSLLYIVAIGWYYYISGKTAHVTY